MLIDQVMAKHRDALMQLPNVIGVAIGERRGAPVIKVYVRAKRARSALSADQIVPSTVEGFETDVESVGEVAPGKS